LIDYLSGLCVACGPGSTAERSPEQVRTLGRRCRPKWNAENGVGEQFPGRSGSAGTLAPGFNRIGAPILLTTISIRLNR
jgi:hypothetical protein